MEYTTPTDYLAVARELVEIVRVETNASYRNSRATVDAILELLAAKLQWYAVLHASSLC